MATLVVSRENVRHLPAPDLGRRLLAALESVELWIERHRQRVALEELTLDQLKDVGLSRADAARESGKPFWMP